MREDKFRAWDKKRKKMWYPEDMQHGDMVDHKNCGDLMSHDIEQLAICADGTIYILDECGNWEYPENIGESYELMQFTGLKDKNGKEAYGLDIIKKNLIHDDGIYIIRFGEYWNGETYDDRDGGFGWFITKINNLDVDEEETKKEAEGLRHLGIAWGTSIPKKFEIIGNVFENPELLKEVSNVH